MRSKTVYILLVFLLLLLPSLGTLLAGPEGGMAREAPVEDPDDSWGSWFETHFAGRSAMVTLNALLKQSLLGSTYGDDIIIGKDGYLFYAGTLDDYFRRSSMSERELYIAAYNLRLMQDYCLRRRTTFLFVLCTNKNTLYPQYMPGHYLAGEGKSNAARLLPYLDSLEVRYIDMYPVLAGKGEIYFRRDTHWTQAGALFGYEAIMAALGRPALQSDDGVWNTQEHAGDLEQMLLPDAGSLETAPVRHVPWTYSQDAPADALNIHTENAGGSGALLMFRDSFGRDLLPYMAQTYAKCWFTQVWPCLLQDVDAFEPQDVIFEKVERNLPDLTVRPLLMESPKADPESWTDIVSDTVIELTPEAALVEIRAEVAAELIHTQTAMYIGVTTDTRTVYQAVLSTGTDGEGNCCYIDLPAAQLEGEIGLEVFLEDAGSWRRVFRGSSHLPDSWTDPAQEPVS